MWSRKIRITLHALRITRMWSRSFRYATMQSALLRYLSSKYYYGILSMMMMSKEGMVRFVNFFDNKNICFGEKI